MLHPPCSLGGALRGDPGVAVTAVRGAVGRNPAVWRHDRKKRRNPAHSLSLSDSEPRHWLYDTLVTAVSSFIGLSGCQSAWPRGSWRNLSSKSRQSINSSFRLCADQTSAFPSLLENKLAKGSPAAVPGPSGGGYRYNGWFPPEWTLQQFSRLRILIENNTSWNAR